jgi:hypothetical protein
MNKLKTKNVWTKESTQTKINTRIEKIIVK